MACTTDVIHPYNEFPIHFFRCAPFELLLSFLKHNYLRLCLHLSRVDIVDIQTSRQDAKSDPAFFDLWRTWKVPDTVRSEEDLSCWTKETMRVQEGYYLHVARHHQFEVQHVQLPSCLPVPVTSVGTADLSSSAHSSIWLLVIPHVFLPKQQGRSNIFSDSETEYRFLSCATDRSRETPSHLLVEQQQLAILHALAEGSLFPDFPPALKQHALQRLGKFRRPAISVPSESAVFHLSHWVAPRSIPLITHNHADSHDSHVPISQGIWVSDTPLRSVRIQPASIKAAS